MKRVVIYPLITVFVMLLLWECKKGEDDPVLSLRSRKARLEGNWKIKEGEIKIGIKDSTGAYNSTLYKLNEKGYTLDRVGKGAHFEGKAELKMSFTKEGEMTFEQTLDVFDDNWETKTLSFSASGTWDFMGKVGKNKNKESVNIQLNAGNNYSNYIPFFNKANTNFTYRIKELRNKKLVLVCEEEMILLATGIGVYVSSEYTLVQ